MTLQYNATIEIASADADLITDAQAGVGFAPQTDIQVTTESSIWIIRPTFSADFEGRLAGGIYLRLPKEGMEGETASYHDRLAYDVNHFYESLTWSAAGNGEMCLNIKPTDAPEGGTGIFTGVIESVIELALASN
jgi:hypothetical protein